jgi:DNA-binding response OmpR family regulator
MSKILIVDDDEEILNSLDILLTANGFTVETESRWQNISRRIDLFDPNLILLDVALGGEDGRNISRQLKSNLFTKNIIIILLTANHAAYRNLPDSLADDFIKKPFEPAALIEKIQFYFSKKPVKN